MHQHLNPSNRTNRPKTDLKAKVGLKTKVGALAGGLSLLTLALFAPAATKPAAAAPGDHGMAAPPAANPLPAPPAPPHGPPTQPGGYQAPTALTSGAKGPAGHANSEGKGAGGATSSSSFTFGSEGPDPVLVVYDTTGSYGYLGQEYAVEAGNLASHFGKVTLEPEESYVSGQISSYNAVIYIGSTYNETLPSAFLNDVLSSNHPVIWLNDNPWQLSGTEGSAADQAFETKYGWDPSSSYFDSTDTEAAVTYKGQTFSRDSAAGPVLAPHVSNPSLVTTLASAVCSSSTSTTTTCASIAQTSGSTFPWAIRSANLTYVGEIPFSYISETDRYLIFSDLLFPVLDPSAPTVHHAMLRLEDVSANDDAGPGSNLATEMTWLEKEKVPFSVNIIPDYVDPNGYYTGGKAVNLPLGSNTALVKDLKTAVSSGYGFINEEGYTHQYSNIANPYDGVSGDDFEFYRAHCSTTPTGGVDPNGCPNTDYVIEDGPLPASVDTASWAKNRITSGEALIKKAGLPAPQNYVMPHYAGSLTDYQTIDPMFRDSYDRKLYFPGQVGGSAPVPAGASPYGQFFPYTVTDVDGAVTLPENLGDFEPVMLNNHAPRTVADLTNEAQLNSVLTDGTASFFFDPDQNDPTTGQTPLQVLESIVGNIQGLGYTFVSPDTMYNQYESFVASGSSPSANPMSVTGVSPNYGGAAGGNSVVVSGSGFSGATEVTWGGQSVAFTINSGSQITLTAPAGTAGQTVDIQVSNGQYTSPTSSADQYLYEGTPTVTSVNPNTVSDSDGGTTVVLTGTGFLGATQVNFCGDPESFTVNSATQITTVSPTGSSYVGGCWVAVTAPGGTSSTTSDNVTFTS